MEKMDSCFRKDDTIQFLLMKLFHRFTTNGFDQFRELGVHPRQLPVLKRLSEREGASQRELADLLYIKPSTVTVTIQRLEKAGLVRRSADEVDMRISRIYLTEQGREAVKSLHNISDEMEKTLRTGFSESEICLLRRFLQQMTENLEQAQRQEESRGHD